MERKSELVSGSGCDTTGSLASASKCSPVGISWEEKDSIYGGGDVYFYCIYFVEVSYFPASSYSKLLVQKY